MSAAGRVTFTSASSSGRRGSPPWRMSSTATASRSISRTTVGCAELVRLRGEPLARLVGQRQRVRHLAHVLHEHQRAQVLEQVEHEPAEILALRRELLDERQRAGRVLVDDEVAQPEQRLLLDRAEQLQHGLHGDLALGRRRELVERRLGVADTRRARRARSARAPGRARRSSRRRRCSRSFCTSSGSRGRWKTNVWQRERTVGSTFARSVVQKTKTRCGGGSSISFSSAFHAASVSWCASSRM